VRIGFAEFLCRRRFRYARFPETPERFGYVRTYVALVVRPRDVRTLIPDEPRQTLADGVAHEVPDMHLLERIRVGVFDHYLLSFFRVSLPPVFAGRCGLGNECGNGAA